MSHLVQLTDRDDQFLGHKMRNELTPEDIFRCISVHITDHSGEYILVQKRSLTKPAAPGRWTLGVMWTLEDGDTYEMWALREIQEELGFTPQDMIHHGVSFVPNHSIGGLQRGLFVVQTHLETDFILQESEVAEVRWVTKQELVEWIEKDPESFTSGSTQVWRELGVLSGE